MNPRDTNTGTVLEELILTALKRSGYIFKRHVEIGKRLSVGRHIVDLVVEKENRQILVSLKWQQVSGTAEQKVPFEIICLIDAIEKGNYEKAYLVLGGEGWKLREFYIGGGLSSFIRNADKVHISTLENFIALVNQNRL
jgi:hypothetical protein